MSSDHPDLFAEPEWLKDADGAPAAAQPAVVADVPEPPALAEAPSAPAVIALRDTAPADIVILACGDLHIDDRMALAGLTPTDRETGEPLVLAQARRTMQWIGDVAAQAGADLILCGGDVFERPAPSNAARTVAADTLIRWADIAPTYVLLGNHDRPIGDGDHALKPIRDLRPGQLHILDLPTPLDLDVRGRPVRLYPVPYPSRSWLAVDSSSPEQTNAAVTRALSELAGAFATDAALFTGSTVLLAHATLRGAKYSEYQTVPFSDPQMSTDGWRSFDLALCSHLHQRQRAPGCPWSGEGMEFTHGYIGAPDRFDFGEASNPVGVSVLRLRNGQWTCEFVENPHARRFVTVDFADFEDWPSWMQARVRVGDQRFVYRVAGACDEAEADAVNAAIRSLKSAGVVVRSALDVQRSDRARIGGVRLDGSVNATLTAVFEADETLRPHEEFIRGFAAQLEARQP